MTDNLKERFYNLLCRYPNEITTIDSYWNKLEKAYSSKSRYYHNLSHLQHLFEELDEASKLISNMEIISMSVFYHDIVYNVRKKDNEEQSAELAKKHLTELGYSDLIIERCYNQILATKSHDISKDPDANILTDADLSTLGKDWNTYEAYFKAIRKEYRIYPNLLYNPARKKVLEHFLAMPAIYKTDFFKNKYEKQARLNLEKELRLL